MSVAERVKVNVSTSFVTGLNSGLIMIITLLQARRTPRKSLREDSFRESDDDISFDGTLGEGNRGRDQSTDSNARNRLSDISDGDSLASETETNNNCNREPESKSIRLVDYVLKMPHFQPKLRLLRVNSAAATSMLNVRLKLRLFSICS